MSWVAIIPQIAGQLLGNRDSDAGADVTAAAARYDGARMSVDQLRAEFQTGSFAGQSMSHWTDPKGSGPKRRDFFRLVAVAVGAIDGGYRQRGDAGAAEALAAAERWARQVDAALGSRLAAAVTAQQPAQFVQALNAIPPGAGVVVPPPSAPLVPTTTTPTTTPAPTTTTPAQSWGGHVSGGTGSGLSFGVQVGQPGSPLGIPWWGWLIMLAAVVALARG